MASNPLHILMIVVIALAGMVGQTVRASVSCCHGVPATVVTNATDGPAGDCCGGCSGDEDRSNPDQDQDRPEEPKHNPTNAPCDGDCDCTLCAAVSAPAGAVLPTRSHGLFRTSRPVLAPVEQSLHARDQRFDLLRPPQC